MTVCIAAVCNVTATSPPTIVTASDRMITIGELEYEPEQTKTVHLASNTVALLAGDMQLHAAVVPKVTARIRLALADNPNNINVADIAEFYAEEFAFYRRKLAEREILMPRGMDFDRFLTRQSTMAHYQVRDIDAMLAAYYLDSTAIVAGIDPTGGHIYKIANPGVSTCWDTPFFACTGSGEHVASTQFMVAGFEKRWSEARTVWLTFSAKTKAEDAGGVGKHTDLVIVRAGGVITHASPAEKEQLKALFKLASEKEAAATQEAVAVIDAYLRSSMPPISPTGAQQAAPADADPAAIAEPEKPPCDSKD